MNVVQSRCDYTLKKGSSRVAQCKFQMSLVIVRAECTEIVSESKIKRNQGKQILYKNPKRCWSFLTSDNLFLAWSEFCHRVTSVTTSAKTIVHSSCFGCCFFLLNYVTDLSWFCLWNVCRNELWADNKQYLSSTLPSNILMIIFLPFRNVKAIVPRIAPEAISPAWKS